MSKPNCNILILFKKQLPQKQKPNSSHNGTDIFSVPKGKKHVWLCNSEDLIHRPWMTSDPHLQRPQDQ